MPHGRDAYAVLQVDPEADWCVIAAAYRVLARRYHPDGAAPDPQRMARINAAYAELRDPVSRGRLDADRQRGRDPVIDAHSRDSVSRPVWEPVPMGVSPPPTSRPRRTEPAERLVLDFGRYAGWRLRDLARVDPDYLRWLSRHSSGLRYRDQIAGLLGNEPDLQRRANSVA